MTKKHSRWLAVFYVCVITFMLFNNCSKSFQALDMQNLSSGSATGESVIPSAPVQPPPATSGTPLIRQIRNGTVIKSYNSLGEAFARVAFRTWENGDIYELDAAVYAGIENQAWLGPLAKDGTEYDLGFANWPVPKNIVIRGLTQNGVRPVIKADASGFGYNNLGQSALYIATSENILVENIDFDGGGDKVPGAGKAGIYLTGAKNFSLKNSRITNFYQANGVFGTEENSGTILFENVETGFNGGDSGPEHNYYMGKSASDQNFTVHWRGCYSHDVYYGHTLKSRAQHSIVEASHFKGKKVVSPDQGEAFLLDFPNGGDVVVRNNILEKDYSGPDSNGVFVTYAMEGQLHPSIAKVWITHNTFVAHSLTYDDLHELYPMNFYYPAQVPGTPGFPISAVVVSGNVFAGFSQDANRWDVAKYRGVDFLELALSDLNMIDFKLLAPKNSNSSVKGQLMFSFPVGTKLRSGATFGAFD